MLVKTFFSFSKFFPDLGIKDKKLEKYCKESSDKCAKYLTFSLIVSILLGGVFGTVFSKDLLVFGAVFFIVFALCFFIFLKLPENEEKNRIKKIEAEMALLLRTFAMLLDMKISFSQALKNSAEHGGEAGKEFKKIAEEIEEGISVSKALAKLGEKSESTIIKKCVSQLISAYEHGAKGEEIKRISDDLISFQRYTIRDFVSKSSFFGLLFVIFAAIVPTFFLIFAVIGGFALNIEISSEYFILIFLILFPLINALILIIANSQMPPSIFKIQRTNRNLAIFCLIVIILAVIMLFDIEYLVKIIILISAFVLTGSLFWKEYSEEEKIEKIEDALPNSLLGVSGLPKNYGIEKIFEKLAQAKDDFAPEAEKTLRQLKANVSAENALLDLWKRNQSFMLRRVGELMINAHIAGANISEKIHEIAEDLLSFGELRRELENVLSIQKYTLILGAFLVPLILTASLFLVSQISVFIAEENNNPIIEIAPNVISSYLIIYAALSALYISHNESKRSRAVPYFIAMVLIGLTGFYLISEYMK